MITNLFTQDFSTFAKDVNGTKNIDILENYYTARISENESELLTKYVKHSLDGKKLELPDTRSFLRSNLDALVKDAYALGEHEGLKAVAEFNSQFENAEFATQDPNDKLQKDIARLQKELQSSVNIERQSRTLQRYRNTLNALKKQAQTLRNQQAIETTQELTKRLDALEKTATINSALRIGKNKLGRIKNDIQEEINNAIGDQRLQEIETGEKPNIDLTPNTEDYLKQRAIEEKLKYLQNQKDNLQKEPPLPLEDDNLFFKWYKSKRAIPIANRYKQTLDNKNKQVKQDITDYTEKINKGTITSASKGIEQQKIIDKLIPVEFTSIPTVKDTHKRPIKRVQRVVVTELAIAYNIGRLKAYLKAGIQFVSTSTSHYSNPPCKYCLESERLTKEKPIAIASLLKNAYKNKGFDKDAKTFVPPEQRYLVFHPYCFVDGTTVTMYDILKDQEYQKNISEIVVGDYVKVPTKNKYQKVVQTHKNHYGEYLYKIRTNTGQTITTTGNHPLWDGINWREAQYFNIGDSLFTSSFESQRTDEGSVRTKNNYRQNSSTIKNQQQVSNDNTESTWYSQNTQRNVSREKQNQYKTKKTKFRSYESQQSNKEFRDQNKNVSEYVKRGQTTSALYKDHQVTKCKWKLLQEWIQSEIRTFRKKWLGIKYRINSSKIKLKIRIRERSSFIRWSYLSTRFLSGRLGCLHRSKRSLDRQCKREVYFMSTGLSLYEDSTDRTERIQGVFKSFQGLSRVYIESIEKFIDPQFVYNISVVDDNMYFANNILSHNCRCFYIPHSKKVEKPESAGVYPDNNAWLFLGGATLAVGLMYLAFALTEGQNIPLQTELIRNAKVPTNIPNELASLPETILKEESNIPVVATPSSLAKIPKIKDKNVPKVSPDLRDPLSDLRTIGNMLDSMNLPPNEVRELQNRFVTIFRNPDLTEDEKLFQVREIAIEITQEPINKLTIAVDAAALKKGYRKIILFKRFDSISKKFEQFKIDDLITKQEENLPANNIIDKVQLSRISNVFFRFEKDINKQLRNISALETDLNSSLRTVQSKVNKKAADNKYIANLKTRIQDLQSFYDQLDLKLERMERIISRISTIKATNIRQQIENTKAIVDRLENNPSVLAEAQTAYENLLSMLVTITPNEAQKYQKSVTDLNRRIKKAQGINLKRFLGNIIQFRYTNF